MERVFVNRNRDQKRGSCKQGNDIADFMKFEEYIVELNKYQLLKRGAVLHEVGLSNTVLSCLGL